MGLTITEKYSFSSQPPVVKRAVRKPQAMNAPMLGITMLLRNFPNLERLSFADIVGPPWYVMCGAEWSRRPCNDFCFGELNTKTVVSKVKSEKLLLGQKVVFCR